MNITIQQCSLFDLNAGDVFFVDSDQSPFMAVGESDDGKRSAVRLGTGELLEFRASSPVRPAPNAELVIRKA